VLADYAAGVPMAEMVSRHGRSHYAIETVAQAHDVRRPPRVRRRPDPAAPPGGPRRGPRRFFTPAEDETIRRMAAEGASDPEIARALGRLRKSTTNRRNALGVPAALPRGPVPAWGPEEARRMAAAAAAHRSVPAAAAALGVSVYVLRGRLETAARRGWLR
jgi:hypothetical protein